MQSGKSVAYVLDRTRAHHMSRRCQSLVVCQTRGGVAPAVESCGDCLLSIRAGQRVIPVSARVVDPHSSDAPLVMMLEGLIFGVLVTCRDVRHPGGWLSRPRRSGWALYR